MRSEYRSVVVMGILLIGAEKHGEKVPTRLHWSSEDAVFVEELEAPRHPLGGEVRPERHHKIVVLWLPGAGEHALARRVLSHEAAEDKMLLDTVYTDLGQGD